jgi:hypothetical protein
MMAISRGRRVLRLAAVAASTLLGGIYIYDRAGGDVFGVRGGDARSRTREDARDEVLVGEPDRSVGGVGQSSGWPPGPIVVDDPFPHIQQQADSPSPFPPQAERTMLPDLRRVFTDPPPRTVLPGSKSDSGIDISIGLQGSP